MEIEDSISPSVRWNYRWPEPKIASRRPLTLESTRLSTRRKVLFSPVRRFSPELMEMIMKQNNSGAVKGVKVGQENPGESELSEAAQAAQEFADRIREEASRRQASTRGANYEVHPCKRVRGYVLRLPVIGWALWYPTTAAAMHFVEKLAAIHRAECCVYDAEGSVHSRRTLADFAASSSAN
jgi:hypothetical protein